MEDVALKPPGIAIKDNRDSPPNEHDVGGGTDTLISCGAKIGPEKTCA